ncbi:MAG: hypothetical protein F4X55_02205 [Candidatus Dadabacteria bacterium]|nr:hypothetical protein [Candidatus Dadabacteria bacterium]MYC39820.1 hypothetical protein [Candidatus Dadabacteria bacterium]
MKTVTLFLMCIMLFAGGTANAFSICLMNMHEAPAKMQMDGDMDMPCHNTEESQDQNSDQCDGCNCLHCVQMNALPLQESKDNYGKIAIGIPAGELFSSRQVETPFQPPKHIS